MLWVSQLIDSSKILDSDCKGQIINMVLTFSQVGMMWNIAGVHPQTFACFLDWKTKQKTQNGKDVWMHLQAVLHGKWRAHPSRMGCRQVWCNNRWAVSTIFRQEWLSLFHRSSCRLWQGKSSAHYWSEHGKMFFLANVKIPKVDACLLSSKFLFLMAFSKSGTAAS